MQHLYMWMLRSSMFTDCFDVPEAGEALCLCGCCGCVADRGASEIGLLCDGSFQIIMPLARHVCGTRVGGRQVMPGGKRQETREEYHIF